MDHLKTIIATLADEEQKELSLFIQRQKKKKSRKDLDLYKLLLQKQPFTTDQLVAKLYPEEPNSIAYHAVRKRLFGTVTDFILLKRQENDPSAAATIRGLLSLASYLFEKQADQLAWQQLRKAEKLGRENEQYELLNSVYNLQIEKALSEYADDLEVIVKRRNENKELVEEEERANIANSWVAKRLKETKIQGNALNFDQITQQVLRQYQLHDAVANRPKLLYQLLSIARSTVLVQKDYFSFEPYLISQYEQMVHKNAFLPRHHLYQVSLLYMIAQTLYRNRKFSSSMQYLDQLSTLLAQTPKLTVQEYYPRYVLLLAMNMVFTGRNDQAISVLSSLLESKGTDYSTDQVLNAQLNLAFCYFQKGMYGKSNQLILLMGHSDRWCEKKMGKEWVLKKNLSELIIQYELSNVDLALNKIRSIERNFAGLLTHSSYKNVPIYLQFIKQLIDQPTSATENTFFDKVQQSFTFLPIEQEDLQAMSFYAWLKSKMVKRSYYEVLLELVS